MDELEYDPKIENNKTAIKAKKSIQKMRRLDPIVTLQAPPRCNAFLEIPNFRTFLRSASDFNNAMEFENVPINWNSGFGFRMLGAAAHNRL